jgi:hypothetical protein
VTLRDTRDQGVLFCDEPSGERALERSTVCRRSVRREHDLDRPFEEWPQPLRDLFARHAATQPNC